MKRFIDTLKNIWKIKELRNRILFTLGLLWVFRLGSFIVLPGADPSVLQAQMGGGGDNSLLGLINVFSGGAFSNASIFALGIMPYRLRSALLSALTAERRRVWPEKAEPDHAFIDSGYYPGTGWCLPDLR